MMKRNGGHSVIVLLGLGVLSNSFFSHLVPNMVVIKKNPQENKCSSRNVASIKSIKINNKTLKELNNKLEKIDLQIHSKSKSNNRLKELGESEEKLNAIKKEVESFKITLLEKTLGIDLAISGIEGQLNFKLDPEVEKVLAKKSEGLSEEKKKELIDQVILKKKEKELLDTDIAESNLVLENIENLNLTLDDNIKAVEKDLTKKISKSINKDQKEDTQLSSLEEQLCNKEEKVKELENEVKELLKDKEDIAKVINRKKIKSEEEEKDDEKKLENSYSNNYGNNASSQGNVQMMLQQTSLMMQAMQMQQMRASMQPLYMSNPFQQDQQKYLYGQQLMAEIQLSQQLGRGIGLGALNAPITNNYYYYGQGNNAFASPFASMYGAPVAGLGLGGQMPFNGANPFSSNFSNSPFNLPNFPRGQAGGGGFFNFGQTPNKI